MGIFKKLGNLLSGDAPKKDKTKNNEVNADIKQNDEKPVEKSSESQSAQNEEVNTDMGKTEEKPNEEPSKNESAKNAEVSASKDKTEGNQGKQPKNDEKKILTNAVDIRERIKKSTLKMLQSLYLTNGESCKSKQMIVWLETDKTTFKSYSNFIDDLTTYWKIESDFEFEKVELKHGKPGKEEDGRKVDLDLDSINVYLQEMEEEEPQTKVKRATISVFANRGSLLKETYILTSEKLKNGKNPRYFIGRGEYPELGSGNYRKNDIAINDQEKDEAILELNRHVSRAHAIIGYSDNIGFYLQVEPGGTTLSGNRTRIIRDEAKINVDSPQAVEQLFDGDKIEFGKAVVLQFLEQEEQ